MIILVDNEEYLAITSLLILSPIPFGILDVTDGALVLVVNDGALLVVVVGIITNNNINYYNINNINNKYNNNNYA